jgi:hypothetical protein
MIVGSFDNDKVIELLASEPSEATHHSLGQYDSVNGGFFGVNRGKGPIPPDYCGIHDNELYKIFFKTNISTKFTQPAELYSGSNIHFLWMDGHITEEEVIKLQLENDSDDVWPARLFLGHLIGSNVPVGIDGLYSCVYTNGVSLFLFRNEYGTMYCNKELDFSTSPFRGSTPIPPNHVFEMVFNPKGLISIGQFETKKHWFSLENDNE